MAIEWNIRARAHQCRACGQGFTDGQSCYSGLMSGEEGFERFDLCDACWQSREEPEALYSAWQSVYHPPAPPPEEPLKRETAETLMRRLFEQEDPEQEPVIYILAVMLERNKMLIERDAKLQEDQTILRVYEHRKTGETFLVLDPRLRLDELETVQEQVVTMLGGVPPSRRRRQGAQGSS